MTTQNLIDKLFVGHQVARKQLCLCEREAVSLERGPKRITCRSGLVWVTRAGDLDDILLGAGESFQDLRGSSRVVLQAMPEALVEVA